jgi:hypothetical protein
MTTLKVTVKGAQGAKVLFKINNKVEKWVECTGETQVLEFDYQLELDKEAPALIIFAGAGNKGESAVFEITNLEFTR